MLKATGVLLAGAMLSMSTGHLFVELGPTPALTRAKVFPKVGLDSQFVSSSGIYTTVLGYGLGLHHKERPFR